ncbi:hypothetical protein [Rivularia sp. UHCC 0363]|uniref:hypothetical protein n=1 Tax=Rivularia sp. UHCC 0363 TaxID=3110244 RepID=UPI002B20726A|nr:hypothetical protein [Rivularia sp. UHCC 0363]MEA5595719.1 hypothetical protein [Rivularia sp. UHCC 0363]
MKEISQGKLVQLVEFDEFKRHIDELPLEQRTELAQKAMGNNPGIVIIGGNNMISNSNVLQLNGNAEDISKQLSNLSPEVIEELLRAIALDMKNKNSQKQN